MHLAAFSERARKLTLHLIDFFASLQPGPCVPRGAFAVSNLPRHAEWRRLAVSLIHNDHERVRFTCAMSPMRTADNACAHHVQVTRTRATRHMA